MSLTGATRFGVSSPFQRIDSDARITFDHTSHCLAMSRTDFPQEGHPYGAWSSQLKQDTSFDIECSTTPLFVVGACAFPVVRYLDFVI